ncbi:SSU ribosomal protein S12P methylthiotransferase [Desulfacinum hydrothermale DSM 13146]|uniref:Ribosomal protein uS12 methylthiotransferase RimO n=1 Tax=Desulfacinum hydrothermale DSM 13146 TaxID=1121390 RepID=A0A1W1XKN8_9BACT|nr:30S ribosomal protein S12 methylthiotransferase RimO [Desulfacinum hydrothermale]SMC24543.1 SSU ribosomal protein S12P methylthiotransferase [Desulfacinum hydrothermale DSM 13146]
MLDGNRDTNAPRHRAALISLGCAKNLVDSEVLAAQIRDLGYTLTESAEQAELIVVNTCGFLETAVQEAVDHLLAMAQFKSQGPCAHLVAVGCMVQRYGVKLPDLLPEVDLFLGTSQYHRFGEIFRQFLKTGSPRVFLERPTYLVDASTARLPSTPAHTAYVKIAEGCSNRCSFCVIPKLRGPYRSRTVEDVAREARALADQGVVEVNLIAQDTTAFGSDRGDTGALVRLLEALEEVDGIRWVRLLYAYPHRVHEDLLKTMAASHKVVAYLDIPFQHAVPRILQAMHRVDMERRPEQILELIRRHLPRAALRTSLMVGFPGETERDFRALCDFVQHMELDHVGVFAFSPEKGCRAAGYPDQVPEPVKEERKETLLAIQQEVSRRKLAALVGQRWPVLVEGEHPETELLAVGRLPTQAPEVDGQVIITEGNAQVGQIVPAVITRTHDYDLEARLES